MKILPCRYCPDGLSKLGPGADARNPDLYFCESYPGSPGQRYSYKCLGCTHFNQIDVFEFNALPEIAPADLPDAVVRRLAPDLTLGGELPVKHAEDLVRAGFTLGDVVAIEPREETP